LTILFIAAPKQSTSWSVTAKNCGGERETVALLLMMMMKPWWGAACHHHYYYHSNCYSSKGLRHMHVHMHVHVKENVKVNVQGCPFL
jgi:hypothetical protein